MAGGFPNYKMEKVRKYKLGPASWPQWFLALLPFARLFGPAAGRHDDRYTKGGTEKDKISADSKFKKDMVKVCGKNYCAHNFAGFYYFCVDKFGHNYFNYREE
jgi:hypothetical protein